MGDWIPVSLYPCFRCDRLLVPYITQWYFTSCFSQYTLNREEGLVDWCVPILRQKTRNFSFTFKWKPLVAEAARYIILKVLEPGHEKTCLSYANNKGADQPAHPRLISAFVVRCLDSVMSLVSVTKFSSLMLASVAEQASLSLTWSETPEDTFSHDEAH